ncbi:MAG: hypothetical protein KTR31_36100 [Myxococcales bacterium]|nr:hypothetical protein [Myxococcales bacterium]
MALRLVELSAITRAFMLDELHRDRLAGTLHFSARLTVSGIKAWPRLLKWAFREAQAPDLAEQLRSKRRMESAGTPSGPPGRDPARVLAEGEFNRFYCRGVCRRAIAGGQQAVEVYRANDERSPRGGPRHMEGRRMAARWLLQDLRLPPSRSVAQVPGGPNSGLSVRLMRERRRGRERRSERRPLPGVDFVVPVRSFYS